MYAEEEVFGKGLGCIATEEILPGWLVLRETPCLFLPPEEEEGSTLVQRTLRAFLVMTSEEQEKYLQLANMFDKDESEWSETARKDMENIHSELETQPFTGLLPSDIIQILQIKLTNGFHNGVFLKMSRFNHSCWPNAEYFWNADTRTRDVRAVRTIRPREEILLDYRQPWTLTRDERRRSLKENFNFDCFCEVCNASPGDLAIESEECEKFLQLSKQRLTSANDTPDDLLNEILTLKKMHKMAIEMKTIKKSLTLKYIIETWFDDSCQGVLMVGKSGEKSEMKNFFIEEAFSSVSLGLNLSSIIYGEEHSNTLKWVGRERDPINFFLCENFPGSEEYIY